MICALPHAWLRLILDKRDLNALVCVVRGLGSSPGATDDAFVRIRMLGYSPDALKGAIFMQS